MVITEGYQIQCTEMDAQGVQKDGIRLRPTRRNFTARAQKRRYHTQDQRKQEILGKTSICGNYTKFYLLMTIS